MLAAGIAAMPSTPMTSTRNTTGAFSTRSTQRRPIVRLPLSSAALARRWARLPAFGTNRRPSTPSSAGSSVTAAATATRTANAAATPMTLRNGMPTTSSPSSAMMTVSPANTTAPPAVATDSAALSSGSCPRASWVRWRERMNRA